MIEYLLPGDSVHGEDGSVLTFQKDGNLVLYSIVENEKRAVWCSDNYNSQKTYKRGGDKVVFGPNGKLVMYKNEDILWQSHSSEDMFHGNLVCITNDSIQILKASPGDLLSIKDTRIADEKRMLLENNSEIYRIK